MRHIKILFLFAVFALSQVKAYTQVEKYMAAFTYQICKSTEWPVEISTFVIGVFGKSDITPFFRLMAADKKIGNAKIAMEEYNTIDEIGNCQVLFVSQKEMKQFAQIVAALDDNPTFIITKSPESVKKGAGLSFCLIDNKIRFNLNKTDLNRRNLIVGTQIERMALKAY